MSNTGIIYGVNGPVIYLKGDSGFKISEMVYVGPEHLVGEIIGLKKGMTTVQVFEETTGLKPGEFVHTTGDTHLYLNHLEQARLQLTRTPPAPSGRDCQSLRQIYFTRCQR